MSDGQQRKGTHWGLPLIRLLSLWLPGSLAGELHSFWASLLEALAASSRGAQLPPAAVCGGGPLSGFRGSCLLSLLASMRRDLRGVCSFPELQLSSLGRISPLRRACVDDDCWGSTGLTSERASEISEQRSTEAAFFAKFGSCDPPDRRALRPAAGMASRSCRGCSPGSLPGRAAASNLAREETEEEIFCSVEDMGTRACDGK